jgi:hypothetical protein
MPTNTAALIAQGLSGLFRQRFNRVSNGMVVAAPFASTEHAAVQYMTTDKPFGLDLRDAPRPLGPRSLHRELTRDFQSVKVKVDDFDLGMVNYSRKSISRFEATHDIDLLAVAASDIIHQGLDFHARETVASCDTLADYGTPIVATSVGSVIDQPIRAAIAEAQAQSRVRANIALIGRPVADRFASLTNTSQGYGVAIGATGNVTAKVGASSDADLIAWFQAKLGLHLIISDTIITNASGTAEYIVGNRMYLLYDTPDVTSEERPSTLKTIYEPGDASNAPGLAGDQREAAAVRDMVHMDVREAAAPRQVGIDVTGSLSFKSHVMWPDSGLRVDITLA